MRGEVSGIPASVEGLLRVMAPRHGFTPLWKAQLSLSSHLREVQYN